MKRVVTGLFLYPIKSLRGIAVEEATLDERGIAHDRRWMLVRPGDGAFVTQRTEPELARIEVALEENAIMLRHRGTEVRLPRVLEEDAGTPRSVQIWGSQVDALAHAEVSSFLSDAMEQPLELVYMPDSSKRRVRRAPEHLVAFADGYPLLIIGEASLADLNARLEAPVEMARFRPNIVFWGGDAFDEDAFESIRIGDIPLRGVKRCDRCVMTTVDPLSGAKTGKEPLRTLATYRRDGGKVYFGMNLVHEAEGTLRVGDTLQVD